MAAPPSLSSFTDLPAVKDLPVSQRTKIPLTNSDYDKFAATRDSVTFYQAITSWLTCVPQALRYVFGSRSPDTFTQSGLSPLNDFFAASSHSAVDIAQ